MDAVRTGEAVTAQPYREPPEPCPDCADREESRSAMHSFVSGSDRHCPECGTWAYTWWPTVCEGGRNFFASPEGFFRWFRKTKFLFKCKLKNPPKHFHLRCSVCNTRWTMLAKSETKGEV